MTRPVLNLESLRVVVAVAERRSFTRAADDLCRTQSAVSLQIRRLEASLGVRLFDRGPLGASPTAAGERLLGFAAPLLALARQAVDEVAEPRAGQPVRLGVMEDFGLRVVAGLVADYGAAHPGSRVELHTGLTAPMVERLDRDLDLVIAMHPQGERRGQLLRRERALWAVGPRFRSEPDAPIPLALYAPGCLLREWALAALDGAGRSWSLAFVGENVASVHAAASGGQALTVVKSGLFPRSLRRAPASLGLPRLPAAEVRLHRATGLSRQARSLADHLVAAMPPQRPGLRPAAVGERP